MPTDLSHDLRRLIVAHLRADATVTALVPSDRIFAEIAYTNDDDAPQPETPFIRMGWPDAEGYEATCWSGSSHAYSIHVFAGTVADVSSIAKRVQTSVENLEPATFDLVENEWRRTNIIQERDTGIIHAAMRWDMTAVEASG